MEIELESTYYTVLMPDEDLHNFNSCDSKGRLIVDKVLSKDFTGFFFTTKPNILLYCNRGYILREVIVPSTVSCNVIKHPDKELWSADKIILGKNYSMTNLETFKLLDIPVSIDKQLEHAIVDSDLDFFKQWERNRFNPQSTYAQIQMTESIIVRVIKFSSVMILDWIFEHALHYAQTQNKVTYIFTTLTLFNAVIFGRLDILRWMLTNEKTIAKYGFHNGNIITGNIIPILNYARSALNQMFCIDIIKWLNDIVMYDAAIKASDKPLYQKFIMMKGVEIAIVQDSMNILEYVRLISGEKFDIGTEFIDLAKQCKRPEMITFYENFKQNLVK